MDKKQKVKVVFTYIIAIAMMYILFYGIGFNAGIAQLFGDILGFDATVLVNFGLAIFSFVAIFIYWLVFRKRRFKGVFSFKKCDKEVYLGFFLAVVVDVILLIVASFFMEGGIKSLVPPTITTFSISLAAGVFEETSFRAIPVSILMKNKPSSLRIYLAIVITAIGFASAHIGNLSLGASLPMTVLQVVSCFITGIFLAAIYLRTGSILLPMCFHFFHDIINLMDPMQSTGVLLQPTITASTLIVEIILCSVELFVGIYLLRKSKHEEIKQRWAEIWNE